jgi:hypothetical protein
VNPKFAKGVFQPRNPEKYIGEQPPIFRSSWENAFFRFLDEHPGVSQWASESVRIPYRHPVTGKIAGYYPDILMKYVDANYKQHVELIEIKPNSQTSLKEARSNYDKLQAIVNEAKWEAARAFCRANGIVFRVVSEKDLFKNSSAVKKPKMRSRSVVRAK